MTIKIKVRMFSNMPHALIMPTMFGIEKVTSSELLALGFSQEKITVSDGRVRLEVDDIDLASVVAKLNFNLRSAERVLIELAVGSATTFDQVFDFVKSLPWHQWLDPGYLIKVEGYSRKSQLYGVPSLQRVIKKAIIEQLKAQKIALTAEGNILEDINLGLDHIRFIMYEDQLILTLDTTGVGLHKRGYRPLRHEAPMRESLASALLALAQAERKIKQGNYFWDPLCGSGTLPIELALILTKTAPGINRHFLGEKLSIVGKAVFDRERELAKQTSLLYYQDRDARKVDLLAELKGHIFASDLDENAISNAKENAKRAGVDALISFFQHALRADLPEQLVGKETLCIITNPPYGERLGSEQEVKDIFRSLRQLCFKQEHLRSDRYLYVISPARYLEKIMEHLADKRRKLYNGMIECTFYQFFRHPKN